MTVKEVMIAARAKIADEKNWTTKAFARDTNGDSVPSSDQDAVCWCAIGAILSVLPPGAVFEFDDLWKPLDNLALGSMVTLNDERTHTEVMSVFDCMIAAQTA